MTMRRTRRPRRAVGRSVLRRSEKCSLMGVVGTGEGGEGSITISYTSCCPGNMELFSCYS